jgi:hypothetical protein
MKWPPPDESVSPQWKMFAAVILTQRYVIVHVMQCVASHGTANHPPGESCNYIIIIESRSGFFTGRDMT